MAKTLLQGNEAVALAAVDAGMTFFGGYPITPASEIMHYITKINVKNKNVKYIQFEDEIASIHSIIGASLAGAKAMTATSGPGFSLMQEALGLAHMTEMPIVVVNVMRVGPSTGMPTLPAQGDIMQSIYGTHGDVFPIIFYPNSVDEIYKTTIDAFNCAEELMSPVILLLDGYVAQLYETVQVGNYNNLDRKRKPLGNGKRHFTGLLSKDNIPKTVDLDLLKEKLLGFKKKQELTAKKYNLYEYIENKEADTLLISFGFVSRALHAFKDKYSLFRPVRMFPVIEDLKNIAKNYKKIIVVEMNVGRYSSLVESLLKRDIISLPLYGGKIDFDYINEKLKNEL